MEKKSELGFRRKVKMTEVEKICKEASDASKALKKASSSQKDEVLSALSELLILKQDEWISANEEDVRQAKKEGMSASLLDRLTLNEARIQDIAESVNQLTHLDDPVSKSDKSYKLPNGLEITRRRVPLGVVAAIFEARPNVAVDIASLCIKSGNACILRGGHEVIHSNEVAAMIIQEALLKASLPKECVNLVMDTSRDAALELMHMDKHVDVLIPRGGKNLIRTVVENSTVPTIRTGEGVCHIYVDEFADIDSSSSVIFNAKCSRPSVCNAVECVLVHEKILNDFCSVCIPKLASKNVEFRCDSSSISKVKDACGPDYATKGKVVEATGADWDAEYDDYILAVKAVDGYEEAVEFINTHTTGHSEAILTENYARAEAFLNDVDAAAVYVNASTRFTDGGEFGLGAEVGISTQKLHVRGPFGLDGLTTCKYVIRGTGQVRE